MGVCTRVKLSKQAEETRTGLQHYGLKSAVTIPPGDGRLGRWDVSDETLDVTKQPFLLDNSVHRNNTSTRKPQSGHS